MILQEFEAGIGEKFRSEPRCCVDAGLDSRSCGGLKRSGRDQIAGDRDISDRDPTLAHRLHPDQVFGNRAGRTEVEAVVRLILDDDLFAHRQREVTARRTQRLFRGRGWGGSAGSVGVPILPSSPPPPPQAARRARDQTNRWRCGLRMPMSLRRFPSAILGAKAQPTAHDHCTLHVRSGTNQGTELKDPDRVSQFPDCFRSIRMS